MHDKDQDLPTGAGDPAARAAADRELLTVDQAVAHRDQRIADTEQIASDTDQRASERDDADAVRDQRAADLDQAAADAQRADPGLATDDEAYASRKAGRTAARIDRLTTNQGRGGSAAERLAASRGRDRNALRRDDTARRRDQRAFIAEQRIADSDEPLREQLERLRDLAARDRASAAADRTRAAEERSEAAADRARMAVELHSAYLDDLTGAFRQGMGADALSLEVDRARRGDGRMVVGFIDVDDLKGVNERAGHAAGDLVLRTLVATMRGHLRSFDPIVRYGGDEFVCAVAGADLPELDRRLVRIRESLYADTGATFTFGLAALEGRETLEQLVARSEVTLHEAKGSRAG